MGTNATANVRVHDINELKYRLIDVWRVFEQNVIDDVLDKWCKHLCACISVREYFEHLI